GTRGTVRALDSCNQRADRGLPWLAPDHDAGIRVVMEEEPLLLNLKVDRFHAWDLEERRSNILHTRPARHALNLERECLEIWRVQRPRHRLAGMTSLSNHQKTDTHQETTNL